MGGNVHEDSLCPLCKFNGCWHQVLSNQKLYLRSLGVKMKGERWMIFFIFSQSVKDLKIEGVLKMKIISQPAE